MATSRSAGISKIGSAVSASERVRSLNSLRYGDISDWILEFYCRCERAGLIEFEAQRQIKLLRVDRCYFRDGARVNCQELFGCSYSIAVDAVNRAIATSSPASSSPVPYSTSCVAAAPMNDLVIDSTHITVSQVIATF